ncbi:tyrosine-type recombinase/integrase [Tunturiibacter gelidiferens]|uniref:tyrosine-type recombinase/integrase n=1 Tax=Tunturiibacter gelidiferens TaxID=3069689 RepID=UPI003D9B2443
MPVAAVRLKIRARLPSGSRAYVDPVFSPNGKLKPLYAVVDGKPEHHPEGIYNLRYLKAGKRVWHAVGTDAQLALTAKLRVEHKLQSVSLGLTDPDPIKTSGKTDLAAAIKEYLSDTAKGKSKRTLYAYTRTLNVFASTCSRQHMEQINRRDVLNYLDHLKTSGNVPRTVANNSNYLKIFFNHNKISWPLEKTDRVKYTEKAVTAYESHEINALLAAADQEESELLQFFLFTGARDQEVQYATWRDLNFTAKTFSVTEKLDLAFTPKDKEEGEIPIPDSLVDKLRIRRSRYPDTRLIFPGIGGKPNGHFLRTFKSLALRAGMNCGHCYNKAGKCCATKPVCKRFELHRFRKTFATMHHEAGISARTIQSWLRHSDLETTLKYLAACDHKSVKTREQVNNTFAFVRGAA